MESKSVLFHISMSVQRKQLSLHTLISAGLNVSLSFFYMHFLLFHPLSTAHISKQGAADPAPSLVVFQHVAGVMDD